MATTSPPRVSVERCNEMVPIISPSTYWWETGVTSSAAALYLERSRTNDPIVRGYSPCTASTIRRWRRGPGGEQRGVCVRGVLLERGSLLPIRGGGHLCAGGPDSACCARDLRVTPTGGFRSLAYLATGYLTVRIRVCLQSPHVAAPTCTCACARRSGWTEKKRLDGTGFCC